MSTSWNDAVEICEARLARTETLLDLPPDDVLALMRDDPTALPGAFHPIDVDGPPPAELHAALADIQRRSAEAAAALEARLDAILAELRDLPRSRERSGSTPAPQLIDRTG